MIAALYSKTTRSIRFPTWKPIVQPMPTRKKFSLIYTTSFKRQVRAAPARYYSLIRRTLEIQLQYEPAVKTRNRKPLTRPMAFNAEWELRFGPKNRFRVFYAFEGEQVVLLAFGEKVGSRLIIEGEEVEP
jgi:hypothetical protein